MSTVVWRAGTCEYCHRYSLRLYPLLDIDFVEHICRDCLNDVRHCRAGGQIAQDPEDA